MISASRDDRSDAAPTAETAGFASHRVEDSLGVAMAHAGVELHTYDPQTTLEELDLDSLDILRVAQSIEDELGVPFRTDALRGVRTIADLRDAAMREARANGPGQQ